MADDRPVDDPADQVAKIQRDLDDFRAQVNARIYARATGDFEQTFRSTPKAGTLLLNGALVDRVLYASLWQFVQDQGLVTAGFFTTGDGSTTFGLPNMAGKVLIGAGTLSGDTYALGATVGNAHPVMTTAQMPSHGHNVSINSAGSHGGHLPANAHEAAPQSGGLGLAAWNDSGSSNGDHTHNVSQSNVGSGSPLDVRQPSLVVNWLVWT